MEMAEKKKVFSSRASVRQLVEACSRCPLAKRQKKERIRWWMSTSPLQRKSPLQRTRMINQ
jgi:hypothetical protein